MKNLYRKIKRKINASKKKRQSVDPITAYKARIEVRIYMWLLDLIAKELEREQAADTPETPTIAEECASAGVQAV